MELEARRECNRFFSEDTGLRTKVTVSHGKRNKGCLVLNHPHAWRLTLAGALSPCAHAQPAGSESA